MSDEQLNFYEYLILESIVLLPDMYNHKGLGIKIEGIEEYLKTALLTLAFDDANKVSFLKMSNKRIFIEANLERLVKRMYTRKNIYGCYNPTGNAKNYMEVNRCPKAPWSE